MPVTELPSRGDKPGEGASAKICDASETVVHWMFQAGYSEAAALVISVAEGDRPIPEVGRQRWAAIDEYRAV